MPTPHERHLAEIERGKHEYIIGLLVVSNDSDNIHFIRSFSQTHENMAESQEHALIGHFNAVWQA